MLRHPNRVVNSLVDRFRDSLPEVPQNAVDRSRLRRALDSEMQADAQREDARFVR